jgi:hypothetical protein
MDNWDSEYWVPGIASICSERAIVPAPSKITALPEIYYKSRLEHSAPALQAQGPAQMFLLSWKSLQPWIFPA